MIGTFNFFQRASCLLFGFLIMILSCRQTGIEENILKSNDFNVISLKPKKKINFRNFAKNVDYVVLETKPNWILAAIDKIEIKYSKIFILSKSQKSIFIFTDSGEISGKISDFGDGPGKYSGISDFEIYDGYIYLLTSPSRFVYKYDLDGNLIETISTNRNYIYELNKVDNGWIAHLKDAFDNENNYNIVYWDSTFSTRINQYLFISNERKNSSRTVDNYISKNKNNLFLFQNFSNLIYEFRNSELLLKYEILVDDQVIPRDYMQRFNSSPLRATNIAIDENIFTGFKKILSTDSILFLESMRGASIVSSFISTNSDKSFSYIGLDFDFDYGLAGNVIGTNGEKFIMKISENILNELKDLEAKGEINETNLKNEAIRRVVNLYEKEGNPVLVFFDVDFDRM